MFFNELSSKKVTLLADELGISPREAGELIGIVATRQFLENAGEPCDLVIRPRSTALGGFSECRPEDVAPTAAGTVTVTPTAEPKRSRKKKADGAPEIPAAAGVIRARAAQAAAPDYVQAAAPDYDGAFLSTASRQMLSSAGFKWSGKPTAPATEAQVVKALDLWCDNDDRNALATLKLAGWNLDPSIAEAAGVGDAGK